MIVLGEWQDAKLMPGGWQDVIFMLRERLNAHIHVSMSSAFVMWSFLPVPFADITLYRSCGILHILFKLSSISS